ncbi:MAG: aconitate hydratase [Chlamydiales bacterium]|nr:aconitate hydratase [Chlamydiia bacterium]MCP5506819.1 aconitate hydratase [Chlamydiales bacterium]
MGKNVTQKLIESHLVEGKMVPGEEIGIRIDQTLTQDATGTMVMLELEAMNLDRVKTELSAQYVDHNILQTDFKNADDHLFLQSACERFGLWFSRAGNGVSHPVHMERFGIPGKTLLGSDSHTPAAGSLGMLAMGAGGVEVAMAMAGRPYHLTMPKVFGIKLTGSLPDWVSAKDVILEMLRRHSVKGGVGWIFEYYGPGLDHLSAMDRHVIANMGTELGATTTVFPSDDKVRAFLRYHGREKDWVELIADADAQYDDQEEINLSELEPLIACPSSPDNVVPVREVAGREVYQSMVGSSANPGYRDFAISALMVGGRQVNEDVSFDINPTSRQILEDIVRTGMLEKLITAGGRIHQAGCNGCIGMGQAPATGRISLRTVPRNFPGRSGTKEDAVYLCSPEVATAAALTGKITDPRDLGFPYPKVEEPDIPTQYHSDLAAPPKDGKNVKLVKGPNIKPLPDFPELGDTIAGPVILKVGNNVSTDEILPAGTRVLPFRSNIPEISKFTFAQIDETFYERALPQQKSGQIVIGGINYGQGSSREHAAIAPRYLGVRAVLVKSFARIHQQNLVNFGILPLTFVNPNDYDTIDQGDELEISNVREAIRSGDELDVLNKTKNKHYKAKHAMSKRQIAILLDGGIINHLKNDF